MQSEHLTSPGDDPLDEALKPPPNETPSERQIRVAREEEARQISIAIDNSIKAERQARKRKRIVRLLLLGQSESGKSTTLRQFQRLYTPTAFREERILWRAVIQLNIVRSVRTILDAISNSPTVSPHASPRSHHRSLSNHRRPRKNSNQTGSYYEQAGPSNGHPPAVPPMPHRTDHDHDSDADSDVDRPHASTSHPPATPFDAIQARMSPLRDIEQVLVAKLVPPNEDEPTHLGNGTSTPSEPGLNNMAQEVFVRPGPNWRGALSRARVHNPSSSQDLEEDERSSTRPTSAGTTGLETVDDTQQVLHSLRKDMIQLWNDPVIREILRRKKIRLEESPGFFLNDLERITSLKYFPSDDDVLRARLKTIGVSEYKFRMEIAPARDTGTEWRIIDVGGSRSQRPTWVPFFDDVDAIIFLAPISAFDQVLTEDRTVNRLEDSVLLWKSVCTNKLLANVDLVLFLNKCDILEAKLNTGVQLSKYIKSYADRENDSDSVCKYLRSKFSAIHREFSPNPRKFYAFCTSVTDTATTAGIIASVRDMVIRQHLKQSKLL